MILRPWCGFRTNLFSCVDEKLAFLGSQNVEKLKCLLSRVCIDCVARDALNDLRRVAIHRF